MLSIYSDTDQHLLRKPSSECGSFKTKSIQILWDEPVLVDSALVGSQLQAAYGAAMHDAQSLHNVVSCKYYHITFYNGP